MALEERLRDYSIGIAQIGDKNEEIFKFRFCL